MFDKLVDIWSPWLPETALKTLGETGWYSADVDGVPGLRIITPNTNYWAFYNTYLIFNSTIADIQWKWIESELERAWNDGVKVYINGHHPPVGQYEGNSADDFWPMYTQKYVQLMEKYHAIIVAGFFGHEHVDEFRLILVSQYGSIWTCRKNNKDMQKKQFGHPEFWIFKFSHTEALKANRLT